MGYITSVLGLQARSRRGARNASRAHALRCSQASIGLRAVEEASVFRTRAEAGRGDRDA